VRPHRPVRRHVLLEQGDRPLFRAGKTLRRDRPAAQRPHGRIRSIAQKRLTAVGRFPQARRRLVERLPPGLPFFHATRTARTRPNAADHADRRGAAHHHRPDASARTRDRRTAASTRERAARAGPGAAGRPLPRHGPERPRSTARLRARTRSTCRSTRSRIAREARGARRIVRRAAPDAGAAPGGPAGARPRWLRAGRTVREPHASHACTCLRPDRFPASRTGRPPLPRCRARSRWWGVAQGGPDAEAVHHVTKRRHLCLSQPPGGRSGARAGSRRRSSSTALPEGSAGSRRERPRRVEPDGGKPFPQRLGHPHRLELLVLERVDETDPWNRRVHNRVEGAHRRHRVPRTSTRRAASSPAALPRGRRRCGSQRRRPRRR